MRILETIYAFDGLMSRTQIDRLFFSGKGRTQPRQRMQALFDHGYVKMPNEEDRHRVPVGEVIYWLDKKGAELVAGLRGESLSGFSWRKRPRWSMLVHDLLVNDFRIAVEQACLKSATLSLSEWVTDGSFRADPDVVTIRTRKWQAKKRQVIPDAFFTIERQREREHASTEQFSFLLEVDLATESNSRFAQEKVMAGRAYLGSSVYKKRFGVSYGRYLIVTTGEKRLSYLKRTAERAGGEKLFYFTTFKEVGGKNPLSEKIWRLAGSEEPIAIIPAATAVPGAKGR